MGLDQKQYLGMGLELRDVASHLDKDVGFTTSDEELVQFIQLNPNYFSGGAGKAPESFENPEIPQFFKDCKTRGIQQIFVTQNVDGHIRLMVKSSLEKLLGMWKLVLGEYESSRDCAPEFYRLEGLLHFVVDKYLDYIDEGGPVCVVSSRFGHWTSLGEMVEDEPYLIYGGEWEYLHEGRWDDPRDNEDNLKYMRATERELVGEDHKGFILLDPVFIG